jgi:hypothetical protein
VSTVRVPVAAAAILLGCAAMIAVHLLSPPAALTWAYAHLDRHPLLPLAAASAALLVPFGVAALWRLPWAAAPVRPLGVRRAAALVAAGTGVVALVGLRWPVTPICIDAWYFATAVGDGVSKSPRWYLTVWTFATATAPLGHLAGTLVLVRALNSVVAAWGLAALAACARTLGRTEGEAAAMTALAWTTFGIAQLALGYVDVYPTALCLTALYLWAGSAVLLRDRHPVWPTTLVAIAPFFYVGLVLLGPSCLVLLWVAGRRHGGRCVAEAVAVAVLVAGAATIPGYGMPFAWTAFAHDLAPALTPGAAIDGRGTFLPATELARGRHWLELGHLLLLLDGVGVLLLATCGANAARRVPAALALWAGAVLAPSLAYLATMDPLFGAFADWDLFSYVAALTAVFGGYAFVVWGRGAPRLMAPLLGVALAASLVHLMARLNALEVDFHRHLAETPFRVPVDKAPPPAP